MRKIIIGLFVLLFITISGCGNSGPKPIEVEVAPLKPEPRLVWHKHHLPGSGAFMGIIEDTENGVEYLCVTGNQCVAICPMIKKEGEPKKYEFYPTAVEEIKINE